MDFLPGLILISSVLISSLERPVAAALAAVFILYGGAVGLALGVQGPFDDYVQAKPAGYVRLARWFSPIQHDRPLLNPPLSVEALFEFPETASGPQPLVAAGLAGSRYLLSAEPLEGGRWRLVSETSRQSGNRETAEVMANSRELNRLRFQFTPENRTVTVHLNGAEVLRHRLDYLITAPAQVMVGIDRTETGMDEPKFGGTILKTSVTVGFVSAGGAIVEP
jgi:hypothetical protein